MSDEDYSKLRVVDLREELKRRKLRSSGLKSQLVQRLLDNDAEIAVGGGGSRSSPVSVVTNGAVVTAGDTPAASSVAFVPVDRGIGGKLPHSPSEYDLWHTAREQEKQDRANLVLWRSPLKVLYYGLLETGFLLVEYAGKLWGHKRSMLLLAVTCVLVGLAYTINGPHQSTLSSLQQTLMWCGYWIGLGILSSVGLGTGLHTFLLYLGPHIAAVTLAAYECRSLDFPSPPYPNEIVCPATPVSSTSSPAPGILAIMAKVRLEAFMWGVGTAIGELPPYFMARAARLTGRDPDDEEMDEFEELLHTQEQMKSTVELYKLGAFDRAKLAIHSMVQRIGFPGILVCASIPNPLFDLAGITCGHFLVPFWTFFGATLIGKAIFKMHIQKIFVIFTFSKSHVEWLVSLVGSIPRVGLTLQAPFLEYLTKQREKLHHPGKGPAASDTWLQWVFEKVVILMILYFLVSILNSFAQNYHKRLYKTAQTLTTGDSKFVQHKKSRTTPKVQSVDKLK